MGDFNLVGNILMVGFAVLCFWLGRKLSNGRRAKKRQTQELAAREGESRQVRRARERQQRP